MCKSICYRSEGKLDSTFLVCVLQSPVIEEFGLWAITITPPCQGQMWADRNTKSECFMEEMTMAEPDNKAGWNYLVLRLRVIKSKEWLPCIIAGWVARLENTWGFWKCTTFKGISRGLEGSTYDCCCRISTAVQVLLFRNATQTNAARVKGLTLWRCTTGTFCIQFDLR